MAATREEIEELLRSKGFGYHRVPLPYGLATPGRDRRPTADLAMPERLDGKSVLDVGCALGYFSFEAERRGAARVVGVELRRRRYEAALRLKEVLDSEVEFQHKNVLTDEVGGGFDLVLALNLIHHLPEPFAALERLAELTRGRLVLEFPTFADRRFREHSGIRLWRLYDRRPVVGVSSVAGADQTFVFSGPAIRRVLRDQGRGRPFERVKLLRSPMAGRMIAICEKPAWREA